jgi:hypothetical protein
LAQPELISQFLSQLSPAAQRLGGETDGHRRTSYLTSITERGIKAHILHIGIEFKNNQVVDIVLEIGHQPI